MRFMSMHKSTKSMEAGELPSQRLMEGMGPLMEDAIRAGIFIAGEGLRQSALGVRLEISGGKQTLTKGPLTGSNEWIDRYLIVRTRSIDEAVEWAVRFAGDADDAVLDIRPVTEPWDLGMMPKPAGETGTRFMIIHKGNPASDPAADGRGLAEFIRLRQEMRDAGVLLSAELLTPGPEATRLHFTRGKRTVLDGPFAESKELIAGFSIMKFDSRDEAIAWSTRFAELFDEDLEIDIRPLHDV
jgi:hypothetical protein